MAITKISATKIEQWLNCPYGYSLKYLKRQQSAPSKGMVFGGLVHKVLEDLNRWLLTQNFADNTDDLFKKILTKGQSIAIQRHGQYSKNTKGLMPYYMIVNNYVRPYVSWVVDNKLYSAKIEPEKQFSISIGDLATTLPKNRLHKEWERYSHILVNGKIDLYIAPGLVIDFKTQNITSFKKSWTNNFQVMLYTLIFDRDMSFMYMFLNKKINKKELASAKESRVDKFNKLIDVIHAIETTKVYHKKEASCATCYFRSSCDRYTKRRKTGGKKHK